MRPYSPQQPVTSHEDPINNAPRGPEEQPALACASPENMLLVLVSNRAPLTCIRSLTSISTRTPRDPLCAEGAHKSAPPVVSDGMAG